MNILYQYVSILHNKNIKIDSTLKNSNLSKLDEEKLHEYQEYIMKYMESITNAIKTIILIEKLSNEIDNIIKIFNEE